VRHTNGVLPMAAVAHERGFDTLFVPASDAPEAALIPDVVSVIQYSQNQHGCV
jgi:magnesium chelatase family protein